jgi:ATP adenylyltransferase
VDRLWSPWRASYIDSFKDESNTASEECFFCSAYLDKAQPAEHLLLFCNDYGIIMMNKYPYNNGHLLVAPNQHTSDINMLSDDNFTQLALLTRLCVNVLTEVYSPQGFNIGANLGRAAGAGVPGHLHYHVLPRWNGDTNFLPVIAEVKVISESIADTYNKLIPYFRDLKS